MAALFASLFVVISFILIGLSVYQFVHGLMLDRELVTVVVQTINTMVISLAMYELGVGIGEEYSNTDGDTDIYSMVRRTITRFVGVVCIALVLESLIMVIKYSQLDLAGNLWYPVGIMLGGSALLIALGGFLRLSRPH